MTIYDINGETLSEGVQGFAAWQAAVRWANDRGEDVTVVDDDGHEHVVHPGDDAAEAEGAAYAARS